MLAWRELCIAKKGDDAQTVVASSEATSFIVADGIGSYSGGGAASRLVVDFVSDCLEKNAAMPFPDVFAQSKMLLESNDSGLRLGTTLTVLQLTGSVARFGHVGDCRIYHLRGAGIVTRTSDQTELQFLLDRGVLNRYDAITYRRSNVLLSLLAPDKSFRLQEGVFDVLPGDRFVICTDGFHRCLSKQQIRDASLASRDLEIFARSLFRKASEIGVTDDASAFLAELGMDAL